MRFDVTYPTCFTLKNKENNMTKTFWLDIFEGIAVGGIYYRSRIAIDIDDFEKKFNKDVVGITLSDKDENDKPSWNVEFIVREDEKKDEKL